jgi:cysteine dioxygenase
VRPVATREFLPGQVCCTQDTDIHQVCNTQSDGGNLVTLHVYSPPLAEMQTWEYDDSIST